MNTIDKILGENRESVTDLIMSTFPENLPSAPSPLSNFPGHTHYIHDVWSKLQEMFPDKTMSHINLAFRRITADYLSAVNNIYRPFSNPNITLDHVRNGHMMTGEQRAKRYTRFRKDLMPILTGLAKDLDHAGYLVWALERGGDIDWL